MERAFCSNYTLCVIAAVQNGNSVSNLAAALSKQQLLFESTCQVLPDHFRTVSVNIQRTVSEHSANSVRTLNAA